MNEPFIIDHNNPKKVNIFCNGFIEKWIPVYPLAFFPDGSCLFVDSINEEYYLKNKTIQSFSDCYLSPRWCKIEEKKYRAFRDDEFDEAVKLLWGKCVRRKDCTHIYQINSINIKCKAIIWENLDQLFENYKYSDSPLSTDWKVIGKECEE